MAPEGLATAETRDPRARRRKNQSSQRTPVIFGVFKGTSKHQGHPNRRSLRRRKWSMKNIRRVLVCLFRFIIFLRILISFSSDTLWPEISRNLILGFGSADPHVTKEAQESSGNLWNGPKEVQKRRCTERGNQERIREVDEGTGGRRAGETAEASTEGSKCNIREPQVIIFFLYLPYNKPYLDWYVVKFFVEPALILGRHLRPTYLDRSTKRHRIARHRPGG